MPTIEPIKVKRKENRMSSNINFGDYLLANEKWLNDKPDSKVNHNTDGVLSSSEISVFFTEHLNFVNNQGELEANKDSFDAWYKENEKNISSF